MFTVAPGLLVPSAAAGGGGSAPYRYWRFWITATNAVPFTAIQEAEFRNVAGGADLSSPATPCAASTSFGPNGNTPAKLVDNDFTNALNNMWMSDGSAFPQWVRADLGSSMSLVEIAMWPPFSDTASVFARAPKDFLLQGSNDASAWTTLRTLVGVTWVKGVANVYTL